MILNTFEFVILLLILVFVVFVLISPVLNVFFDIHEKVQTSIETEMFGNITNSTQKMLNAYENVENVLPWMVIFAFVVGVLIWVIWSEQVRRGE